jgi:hypothetical protein
LAAFVKPTDPSVDVILREASDKLAAAGRDGAMDGYRKGTKARAWQIADAIWAALVSHSIADVLPPKSFERFGQQIRGPSDILSRKVGTCLDLTLLYTSCEITGHRRRPVRLQVRTERTRTRQQSVRSETLSKRERHAARSALPGSLGVPKRVRADHEGGEAVDRHDGPEAPRPLETVDPIWRRRGPAGRGITLTLYQLVKFCYRAVQAGRCGATSRERASQVQSARPRWFVSCNREICKMPHSGGCSCGKVRYDLAAEPIRGFHCQCRDCQRDTGAGHASVMVFRRDAMRVSGPVCEILRTADSGAHKLKGFCGSCGSPLYNKPVSKPDLIGIYVGTLDDPSGFKPEVVMFALRGQPWDHLDPALPKLPAMRTS